MTAACQLSAAVQAAPPFVVSLGALFMGVALDQFPPWTCDGARDSALRAEEPWAPLVGGRWYAALMLIDAALVTASQRVRPAFAELVLERQLDRVSGWASTGTNAIKALGLAAGPYLVYSLNTAAFVLVAAGHGLAAVLLARMSRTRRPRAAPRAGACARWGATRARAPAPLLGPRADIHRDALLLAHVLWGLEEVLALPIAEHGLGTLRRGQAATRRSARWPG